MAKQDELGTRNTVPIWDSFLDYEFQECRYGELDLQVAEQRSGMTTSQALAYEALAVEG